tara:strand:+ start:108 stop:260 length:153 start_codon:yes stop_codon:yes gene_type:complete
MSGYGEIYCESWWGDNNRDAWGYVYPVCSSVTADRADFTVDTTLTTSDQT